MQKSLSLVSTLILFILATGCHNTKYAASSTGNSEVLYLHQWSLEELNGQAIELASMRKPAHLLFTGGQTINVTGNTGCNNLRGSFELSGTNSIKFSPFVTTKIACPGGDNIETKFLAALAKANNWIISNDQLVLKKDNKELAKFKAVAAETAGLPAVFNGTWELDYITGKRIAFSGLYPDKKPQLVFADTAATEVSGHTSCNSFSSKLWVNDNTINITDPIAMTMMACGGEGEKTFLDMLKKVNKYDINENRLTLMIDDVAVMRFAKK